MPNVTKILRWFQPNNFLWKRDRMLFQNVYIRGFRDRSSWIRSQNYQKTIPDIDFSHQKNTIFTWGFFFLVADFDNGVEWFWDVFQCGHRYLYLINSLLRKTHNNTFFLLIEFFQIVSPKFRSNIFFESIRAQNKLFGAKLIFSVTDSECTEYFTFEYEFPKFKIRVLCTPSRPNFSDR